MINTASMLMINSSPAGGRSPFAVQSLLGVVIGKSFAARLPVFLCWLLSTVFIAPVFAADVSGVRLWRAPDNTRVVFDLSGPSDYSVFTLDNPRRLVVDIKHSQLNSDFSQLDFAGSPITTMRGAARNGSDLRVVLELGYAVTPKHFTLPANQQYGDRLVLDLFDQQSAKKPVASHRPNKNGKRDIVVAIDAGHGGEDPGALGPNRIKEKHVVMSIARALQKRLDKTPGYRAEMIRDGDYYIGLRKRRDLARQKNADVFISIHADAFKDRRVHGSSVYTLSSRGASSASAKFLAESENRSDQIGGVELAGKDDMLTGVLLDLSMTATLDSGQKVARALLSSMAGVGKLHKRTVEHAGFAVLKSPDIPSVLVESGFISNPKEARRLASTAHQEKVADALYKGIKTYFSQYAPEGSLVYWQAQNGKLEKRHRVVQGDTLSEIAERYRVSMAAIRRHNGLNGNAIRIGQTLKIPASS